MVCGTRTGKSAKQCNVDTPCVEILGSSSSLRLIMLNLRTHHNLENLSKAPLQEHAEQVVSCVVRILVVLT